MTWPVGALKTRREHGKSGSWFSYTRITFFFIPQSCKAVSPQIATAILAACNQRVLFHFLLLDSPATDPKLLQASDRPNSGKSVRAPERIRSLSHCVFRRGTLAFLVKAVGKDGWVRDVRGQGTGANVASVRDGGGICQPLT